MKKLQFLILTIGTAALLTSCSYFQRKSCESKNWFEHGKQIALKGMRISGDNEIKECRKVEADINEAQIDQGWKAGQIEFCSPKGAFEAGNRGQLFQGEICNPGDTPKLLAANKKGIANYCSPTNGEELGRTGKSYEKVCPEELLNNFVDAYKKGRKNFLSKKAEQLNSSIINKQSEASFADGKLTALKSNLQYAQGRLHGLSATASLTEKDNAKAQFDNAQREYNSAKRESDYLKSELNNLKSEFNNVTQELSGL